MHILNYKHTLKYREFVKNYFKKIFCNCYLTAKYIVLYNSWVFFSVVIKYVMTKRKFADKNLINL